MWMDTLSFIRKHTPLKRTSWLYWVWEWPGRENTDSLVFFHDCIFKWIPCHVFPFSPTLPALPSWYPKYTKCKLGIHCSEPRERVMPTVPCRNHGENHSCHYWASTLISNLQKQIYELDTIFILQMWKLRPKAIWLISHGSRLEPRPYPFYCTITAFPKGIQSWNWIQICLFIQNLALPDLLIHSKYLQCLLSTQPYARELQGDASVVTSQLEPLLLFHPWYSNKVT